MNPSFSQGTFN